MDEKMSDDDKVIKLIKKEIIPHKSTLPVKIYVDVNVVMRVVMESEMMQGFTKQYPKYTHHEWEFEGDDQDNLTGIWVTLHED